MDKIKVYDPAEDKFEYGAVWIKNPVHRKGDDPHRFKATNVKETELINKHLNNLAMEELNLFPDQKIKPMFDRDSYDIPIDTEYDIKLIKNLLGDNCIVKTAARPTRIKNGKTFYSKRYYVQNKRIRAFQLLDFINMRSEIPKNHFDLSKYGKGGQFYTLYNDKKLRGKDKDGKYQPPEVVPSLVPENDPKPNPLDYYATYVLEDYEDYDLKWEVMQVFKLIEKSNKEDKVVYKEDDEEVVVGKSTEIDDIIEHLKPERAHHYETWYKVPMAIINYGLRLNLSKKHIELLIHEFSKKSVPFYEEDKVDEWLTNNYDRIKDSDVKHKLGRNYLINVCLKEDDPKYWADKYRCRDYKSVLKKLNEECIKIRMNKSWLIFRKIDEINKEPYFLYEKDKLIHYYGTQEEFCFNYKDDDGKIQTMNIINSKNYWTDVNMASYDNLIYAPCYDSKLDKKYFNTWDGWNATKYKVCKDYTKCEIFLTHLKEVWCNDDEILYKWFLEYFSVIIRGGRTCVVPIIRGKQKCGKDCFMTDLIMNKLIGLKYTLTTNDPINQVFGRFNNALLNMSLVVMAEGGYDLSVCYDKFKDLITNAVLRLEGKFVDIVSATNYTNFIISTNKYDIIKGDKGMDNRRIIYIDCSNKYLGNTDYFKRFYDEGVNNEDAVSAFYHYLIDPDKVKQVSIDDLSYLQETKPETKMTKDIATKNTAVSAQFIYEYFNIDTLTDYVKNCKGIKIKRSEVYAKYRQYVEYNGYERLKMDLFSSQLLTLIGIECKRNQGEFYYVFSSNVLNNIITEINKAEEEGNDIIGSDYILHTDKPSYVD